MVKQNTKRSLTIAFGRQIPDPHYFHKHDALDPSTRARELICAGSQGLAPQASQPKTATSLLNTLGLRQIIRLIGSFLFKLVKVKLWELVVGRLVILVACRDQTLEFPIYFGG